MKDQFISLKINESVFNNDILMINWSITDQYNSQENQKVAFFIYVHWLDPWHLHLYISFCWYWILYLIWSMYHMYISNSYCIDLICWMSWLFVSSYYTSDCIFVYQHKDLCSHLAISVVVIAPWTSWYGPMKDSPRLSCCWLPCSFQALRAFISVSGARLLTTRPASQLSRNVLGSFGLAPVLP